MLFDEQEQQCFMQSLVQGATEDVQWALDHGDSRPGISMLKKLVNLKTSMTTSC